MNANLLRRVNWLWKHRHTHDGEDFQEQITVIKTTVESQPDDRPVGPFVVVAGEDASDQAKTGAWAIADGLDDYEEIAAALTIMGTYPGTVYLEGTFNVDAGEITVPANTRLLGTGRGAVLKVQAGSPAGAVIASGGNRAYVESLEVDGNGVSGNIDGVHFLSSHIDCRAINFSAFDMGRYGIHAEGAGPRIYFSGHQNCAGGCVYLASTADGAIVDGVSVRDSSGSAFGIKVDGTERVDITGVNLKVLGGPGAVFDSAVACSLTGIIETPDDIGVEILDSSIGVTVDVVVNEAGEHGVSVVNSDDCAVKGTIYKPGQKATNTYDGIFLGNSDRTRLLGCAVIPDATVKPRWGINISNSTCNDTKVGGNVLLPLAGFGTGQYNDQGTATSLLEVGPTGQNVHAYRDTDLSIANATWVTVTLPSERFDVGNFHSTSTNTSRLTAAAGTYLIGGAMTWSDTSTAGTRRARLIKNGATVLYAGSFAGHNTDATSSTGTNHVVPPLLVALAAGDYVEIQAFQDSGGSLNLIGCDFWAVRQTQ